MNKCSRIYLSFASDENRTNPSTNFARESDWKRTFLYLPSSNLFYQPCCGFKLVVCVVKMLSYRKRKVVEKIGETGSEEMEVDIFSSRP